MRCPRCDTELLEDAKFCHHCDVITEPEEESDRSESEYEEESSPLSSTMDILKVRDPDTEPPEHMRSLVETREKEREKTLLYGPVTVENAVEKQRAWALKIGAPIDWENSIGMKFKLIPAGEFMMGSERWTNLQPVHKVRITKPFYMGVFPVTQREWMKIASKNPSYFKGDDHPVERVSWDDCQEFIKRLNKRETGWKYRLQTEAEGEYACRAGSRKHCLDIDKRLFEPYEWFIFNSNTENNIVVTKEPNRWGLQDMAGKIWEWCEDWYETYYYKNSPEEDPTGPSSGSKRVIRGVRMDLYVYNYYPRPVRLAFPPDFCCGALGFRLVRSL